LTRASNSVICAAKGDLMEKRKKIALKVLKSLGLTGEQAAQSLRLEYDADLIRTFSEPLPFLPNPDPATETNQERLTRIELEKQLLLAPENAMIEAMFLQKIEEGLNDYRCDTDTISKLSKAYKEVRSCSVPPELPKPKGETNTFNLLIDNKKVKGALNNVSP